MRTLFTIFLLSCSCALASPYQILAPATRGGGYDTLARHLSKSLNDANISQKVDVYNLPGNGGVKGLQKFVKLKGDGHQLVVFGLTTIGAMHTVPKAGVSLKDLTPVARLVSDYEVILVSKTSKITDLQDLIKTYKANPNLRFGGASLASAGQMFLAGTLSAGGAKIDRMNWVSSSGNLQGIRAMLQNEVDVVSVSLGVALDELPKGKVRALAISAPIAVPGVSIPTAKSQGIHFDIANWRGVFAPAGLTEAQRLKLNSDFAKLSHSAIWRKQMKNEKQTSSFQSGLKFSYFLENEEKRIVNLLEELGLAKK